MPASLKPQVVGALHWVLDMMTFHAPVAPPPQNKKNTRAYDTIRAEESSSATSPPTQNVLSDPGPCVKLKTWDQFRTAPPGTKEIYPTRSEGWQVDLVASFPLNRVPNIGVLFGKINGPGS